MDKQMKILVADDNDEIREVLRVLLESEGFEVIEAANGEAAVEKADFDIDLIILDIMMPGKDGFKACQEIRAKSMLPILFLTAKTEDSDKMMGFSSGADDYMVKPFSYTEIITRVKALLRRCYEYQSSSAAASSGVSVKTGALAVNTEKNLVTLNGEEIVLTDIEYNILKLLITNRKKIFSTQNIYESVWHEPYFYTANNTVMVHIRKLRTKIEDDPQNPKYVKTVWGRGYRIE